MPTKRQRKYDYLIDAGLLHLESNELTRQYNLRQLRSIPYLQALIRNRRLTRANIQKQGVSYSGYKRIIKKFYTDNGYRTIWDILRKYRKKAIDEGDYIPPKRKGSHHPTGVSKGQLTNQKFRRAERKDTGVKPDTLKNWIAQVNESIRNADDQRKAELTVMRDRMQKRLDSMKE